MSNQNWQTWLGLTENSRTRLLTVVVGTHFHQVDKLKSTMNTSNRLVGYSDTLLSFIPKKGFEVGFNSIITGSCKGY